MSSSKRIPKYSLHKPSGQARVIINGRHHYLGKFGSVESQRKYAELLHQQFGLTKNLPECDPGEFPNLTVDELLVHYLDHAESYYSRDGQTTKEYTCMVEAVRHLRPRYGSSLAMEFGPKKLATVRQDMISQGLAQGVINNRINRIKRAFKWGVSIELVPASVYQAVRTLDGLKFGRSAAKETEPVKPVPDASISAVAGVVSPQVGAMIRLQRYTGMRPGEVVIMRPCDIKMTGKDPGMMCLYPFPKITEALVKSDTRFAMAVETLRRNCGDQILNEIFSFERPQTRKAIERQSRSYA